MRWTYSLFGAGLDGGGGGFDALLSPVPAETPAELPPASPEPEVPPPSAAPPSPERLLPAGTLAVLLERESVL